MAMPVQSTAKPAVKNLRWAYIMNFIYYVSWPDHQKNQDIYVCVVGSNPFNHISNDERFKNKTGNLTIARLFETVPEIHSLNRCHVVYFSQSISLAQLSFLFTQLNQSPIMTIGDHGAFVKLGGVLQFRQRGKKLRFSLNKEKLSQLDLKVHPALLRLSI